jgi:hypothetical protein
MARALLRPGTGGAGMVFQLHPQGYKVEAGHVVKLELLPADAPYSRPSNSQGPIDVQNLELRLPVVEQPGSGGGVVQDPAPEILPPGYTPAIDFRGPRATSTAGPTAAGIAGLAKGGIRATRKALLLRLRCAGAGACSGSLSVSAGRKTLAGGGYSLAAGATQPLRLPLTKAGRKFVARKRKNGTAKKAFRAKLAFADAGRGAPFELKRPVRLKRP